MDLMSILSDNTVYTKEEVKARRAKRAQEAEQRLIDAGYVIKSHDELRDEAVNNYAMYSDIKGFEDSIRTELHHEKEIIADEYKKMSLKFVINRFETACNKFRDGSTIICGDTLATLYVYSGRYSVNNRIKLMDIKGDVSKIAKDNYREIGIFEEKISASKVIMRKLASLDNKQIQDICINMINASELQRLTKKPMKIEIL